VLWSEAAPVFVAPPTLAHESYQIIFPPNTLNFPLIPGQQEFSSVSQSEPNLMSSFGLPNITF
jgi:hypothetical protein